MPARLTPGQRRLARRTAGTAGPGLDSADPLTAYLTDPETRLHRPAPAELEASEPVAYPWPPTDDEEADPDPRTDDTSDGDGPDGFEDHEGVDPGPSEGTGPVTADPRDGTGPVVADASGGTGPVEADRSGSRSGDPDGGVVLAGPAGRSVKLPAVVPAAWRHPKALAEFHARRGLYLVKFHGIRVGPVYLPRLVRWTPRGMARTVRGLWDWAVDAESRPLRLGAIQRQDVGGYALIIRQRQAEVRNRKITAAIAAVLAVAAVGGSVAAGGWLRWLALAGLVGVFGPLGRPQDVESIVDTVDFNDPRARKITPDLVSLAFIRAGLAREDHPIQFHGKWGLDGPGYRGIIHLPAGITAAKAIAKRMELASALGMDESRVFLKRVRGDAASAGQVELWLPHSDPYSGAPVPTPLLKATEVDFWKPFPFGTNESGALVRLPLIWASLLIGAIPRHGKTFALRLVIAAAALDAYVRLIVFDAKGGGDLRGFVPVAFRCGFGERLEVVQLLHQTLTDAVEDMNDRYERIAQMPPSVCPENKLTQAIARNKRLNMPLVLIAIDECQDYFAHPDLGDQLLELCIKLAKKGPAVGIMLVLATQKPDKDSLPSRLRDVFSTRFALRTMSYQTSEMILGTGTKAQGFDSSTLRAAHKGVGFLVGADVPEMADTGGGIVRTHYMDNTMLARIIDQARANRDKAGTLDGQAAGEEPELAPVYSLLEDVAEVFEPGEDWLWSETILERLTEAKAHAYSGWDTTAFGKAMAGLDCPTGNIQAPGTRTVKRGVRRTAVLDALAARLDTLAPTPA